MLPLTGIYDVMLFEIRRNSQVFNLGVAFPSDSSVKILSFGLQFEHGSSLIEHGLAQVRQQLDMGVEEDGRIFESPLRLGTLRVFGSATSHRHFA